MAVRDELKDPWSYVVAGLAGGLTWALIPAAAAAGPLGIAVGAVVLGAKCLAGAVVRPAGPKRARSRLKVMPMTEESAWIGRALRAQQSFEDVARSAPAGPIAERVATFGAQTAESLAALDRLAGQASAIRLALARLDIRRLQAERDRLLAAQQPGGDPQVVAARSRSLQSVTAQLETFGRLTGALTMLLARLESGALGLEGLVARLAEVVALAETSQVSADGLSQVDELATELEGLRAGLVEAEGVTTRAMQGLAPLSPPATGTVPEQPARRRATE